MSSQWFGDLGRLWILVVITLAQILWMSENALSAPLTNFVDHHHARVQLPQLQGSRTLGRGNQTGSAQDRAALVVFKNEISDSEALPTWNSTTNPDVCSGWEGIRCSDAGRVIVLNISMVGYLGGGIRSALENLTSLEALDLSGCNFEGGIPSALGDLMQLQLLNLSKTYVTGSLPDVVFGLPSLRSLDLSESMFTGGMTLSRVRNLAKLEVLHLSSVRFNYTSIQATREAIRTFPKEVLSLPRLRSLDLSYNYFDGDIPSGLWASNDLEFLNLKGNFFNGTIPETVLSFPKLRLLDLTENRLTGIVPDGLPMLQLEELDMSTNHLNGTFPKVVLNSINLQRVDLSYNNFEGVLPEAMLNLLNLRHLDLYDNSFAGAISSGLQALKEIEYLDLCNNLLNGTFPEVVFNLPNLRFLDLSQNSFTGVVPSGGQVWKQLETLDLSDNSFNGTFPQAVLSATNLTNLGLGNNFFTGDIPLALQGLSQLRVLNLGSNSFNGQFPEGILRLPNLSTLQLDQNYFFGSIPFEVWLLAEMGTLDLSNNLFNGTLPEVRWRLPQLSSLHLQSNHFSGTVPTSFYNLTSLTYLDVSDNYLRVHISSQIDNLSYLYFLNLSSNSFTGEIPSELSNCSMNVLDLSHNNLTGRIVPVGTHSGGFNLLAVFQLASNHFYGDVPSSLASCTDLQILDLSDNWLTDMSSSFSNLSSLRVLQLNSNKFSGEIPSWIWGLPQLQILDLSKNAFEGHVRDDLIVWNGMKIIPNDTTYFTSSGLLEYAITITFKDIPLTFTYILPTLASIDLSANQLVSSIPKRLIDLKNLRGLNLSHNTFTSFPSDSKVAALESLDISFNKIQGSVPSFLGESNSLEVLKLGGNNFSGPIPRNGFLSSVNDSTFWPGNPYLCGLPWTNSCLVTASPDYASPFTSSGAYNDVVSFLALGIGAALGFVWVGALLILYRPARRALFILVKLPPECGPTVNHNYDRKYGLFREQGNRRDR